jgi:hypothetical protein
MREEGIEPTTAGSGIQRSTTELFPHRDFQPAPPPHTNPTRQPIPQYIRGFPTTATSMHSNWRERMYMPTCCPLPPSSSAYVYFFEVCLNCLRFCSDSPYGASTVKGGRLGAKAQPVRTRKKWVEKEGHSCQCVAPIAQW